MPLSIICVPKKKFRILKNIIPPPPRQSLWRGYIDKFRDPLIIVLLVIFCFSVGVSIYELRHGAGTEVLFEPVGVLVALLLATGVGFILEVKAEEEFKVLNQTNDSAPVKVFRQGQWVEIPKQDVEVGDLVRLESGDEVPADGLLEESHQLRVDESAFTGEPSARKSHLPLPDEHSTYAPNCLLRGSTVMEGYGLLRITAIGIDTEEGRGAMQVREGRDVETPLNSQLGALGKQVSGAAFAVAALIVVGRLIAFYIFDCHPTDLVTLIEYILSSIMIAVTLIVVAVPEGLPMSITMSLAMSMRRMLRENNLVRKLHACETMGAATVICTDKTGTLTQNRMQVVEVQRYDYAGWQSLGLDLMALDCALNSTAELSQSADGESLSLGNPTECALLHWLQTQGVDYRMLRQQWHTVDCTPFSSERKYMSTTVECGGRRITFYKGASEILLPMCTRQVVAQGEVMGQLAKWQGKAMRTLGFAAEIDGECVFLGIVGIMDPLREDVREAISVCTQRAGVRVIIVTGDTVGTAREIGLQIGLINDDDDDNDNDNVITGPQFAVLSDEEALERVATIQIIARARPEDKARLVQLLQRRGEVVAVTGDGTNDAPALAKAQVGLSMGSGTAHAKEASDITIIDNSFASINRAILWGRSLYQNIRRFLLFQLTVNIAACLIVLVGAFTGIESPLSVTQMLWVNLIMDTFAAMALSSLPADTSVMDERPRSQTAHIIDRPMLRHIISVGTVQFLLALLVWEAQSPESLLPFVGEWLPQMQFFTFFVMLQFWNLFNARYYRTRRSLLLDIVDIVRHPERFSKHFSMAFVAIAMAVLVGQIAIVELMPELFQVDRLSWSELGRITLLTAPFLIIPDLHRTIKYTRQ